MMIVRARVRVNEHFSLIIGKDQAHCIITYTDEIARFVALFFCNSFLVTNRPGVEKFPAQRIQPCDWLKNELHQKEQQISRNRGLGTKNVAMFLISLFINSPTSVRAIYIESRVFHVSIYKTILFGHHPPCSCACVHSTSILMISTNLEY